VLIATDEEYARRQLEHALTYYAICATIPAATSTAKSSTAPSWRRWPIGAVNRRGPRSRR
jgi:hypothetical protein